MGTLPIALGIAVALFVAMLGMLEAGHDLENPRLGLLRVDAVDHSLTDLRATMS